MLGKSMDLTELSAAISFLANKLIIDFEN